MKKIALSLLALSSFAAGAAWAQSMERDEALERLESLMQSTGTKHVSFTSMRLLERRPSPIAGLETLIYDVMVEEEGGRTYPQRIAVFSDKSRRYLVMGAIIDINTRRDLADEAVAAYKDRDLSLSAMQRVPLLPNPKASRTVTIVIDLGHEKARRFLDEVMRRRKGFTAHVELALVSDAKQTISVGAQAIIAGSAGEEFFYDALSQWLRKAERSDFLDAQRLRKDPNIQARLGRGIFHVERNTTELLEAGLSRLPLLLITDKSGSHPVATPRTDAEWASIFGG